MTEPAQRRLPPPAAVFPLAMAVALGAVAVAAQSILLRELSLLWFGSELSWGMTLSGWLGGVAIGAAAAGAIGRFVRPQVLATIFALLLAATLPAGVWTLRSARTLLGIGAGEFIATGQMLALTAATAGAAGLWVGALFPAGAALAGGGSAAVVRSIGAFFVAEAVGTLAGGVAFTFWWVERADPFTLTGYLSGALLLAAAGACLARRRGRRRPAANVACGLVAALAGGMLIAAAHRGFGRWAEQASQLRRWAGLFGAADPEAVMPRVAGVESRFGRIDLGELAGQWSLYLDCRPAGTFPDRYAVAPFVHLAASQCPKLESVLVIGPATSELAVELARYPDVTVTSVELDERVGEVLAAHVEPTPRRPTYVMDGRHFVKTARDPYDLIILAAGDPTSIAAGRFYTREFFVEARDRLTSEGVLAFALAGPAGKISPDLRDYLGSIHHAAEAAFGETLWTWGDPTWVFAARREGILTADAEQLKRRYIAHAGPAGFDPDYLLGYQDDRLQPEKLRRLAAALAAAPPGRVNTDDRPVAMFLHLKRQEQTLLSLDAGPAGPKRRSLLALLGRAKLPHALAAVAVIGALGCGAALLGKRKARPAGGVGRPVLLLSLATTGVATIGLEIVLLAAYQNAYGYVYSHIALIVAMYMFGVAMGAWRASRAAQRRSGDPRWAWRHLLLLDLALCGACLAVGALQTILSNVPFDAGGLGSPGWFIFPLVTLIGGLGGRAVPLAAGLYPRRTGRDPTAPVAGAVDAADCLGGAVGALACGRVLLPLLGAWQVGAVLAMLKLTAVAALLIARPARAGVAGEPTG